MPAATSCRCDARDYRHAHCYCIVYNCSGKAVSRSTYQYHRKADEELHIHRNNEQLEARSDEGSGEGPQITRKCTKLCIINDKRLGTTKLMLCGAQFLTNSVTCLA